jgi:hypothetical protein
MPGGVLQLVRVGALNFSSLSSRDYHRMGMGTTPRRNKEPLQKFLAYLVRAMPLYFLPRAGERTDRLPRYFCSRLGRPGGRAGRQAASLFLLATRAGGRADRLPRDFWGRLGRAGGLAAAL